MSKRLVSISMLLMLLISTIPFVVKVIPTSANPDPPETREVSQAVQLTTHTNHDRNPSFFRASDGKYWLFYVHGRGPELRPFWDVHYMTSTDNGTTWSTPTNVSASVSSTGQRGMAALQDDTGKIWVFVSASKDLGIDSNLHYYTFNGTTWTGPTDVPGPISGSHVDAFQSANGSIWIFYESAGIKCMQTPDYGTSWSSVITVSATGGIPKAIEADGKLHAVWCEWPTGKIYYSNSTDGVTWSASQVVVDVVGKYNNDPVISVDSNGTYWLFYAPWTGRGGGLPDSQWIEVVYSSDDGATWSSRINVTGGGCGTVYWDDMWPEPYLDSDGKMLLFYTSERDANGTSRIDRNIWMHEIVWDLRNNHYEFIQTAIDVSSPGDTIIVHDGTYNEALYIDKSLTVRAASKPIIKGSQLFATDFGNREAVIFVENAANVVLEDLDIEGEGLGPGPIKSYGVIYENSSGTILDCIVSPNTIGDMYSAGTAGWSGSDVTIEDCEFKNFGRIGIYSNAANLVIRNNTIIGQVYSQDNLVNYGIEIEDYSGASTAEIVENEIYNSDNTHPSPLWSSAAIIVDIWRMYYDLPPSTVSIERNNIHDNYEAVQIVSSPLSYAHYNNIYNNRYGVYVDPDLYGNNATFDARFNWWGDASGPTHSSNTGGTGNSIGDYVDYSPWLGFVVGTSPMTWHVNPTGAPSAIQEAIDEAVSGDTIIVHDGTYLEALYISKSLTIKAASTPIIKGAQSFTINYMGSPWTREAVIFVVNSANVIIEGFDIEGEGLGPGPNDGVVYVYSSGEIRNCIVSPNTVGDMASVGIENRASDVIVSNCTIENFGRIGVYFANCTGGVYDSTIIGQRYNDRYKVNYGIEVEPHQGVRGTLEIIGNDIYDCDNTYEPEPEWSSAGIVIDGWLSYMSTPSSTVVIRCNNIHDNYYGIEVVANPYSYAHYNNIYNNREYGVIQDPDYLGNNVTFDARFNWWSDASGPYHLTLNPSGLGDNVSDNVSFAPWLLQEKIPPLIHDIAVISVVPNVAHQYPGRMVNITVVVKNNGNMYETFNVTARRNSTEIGTILVTDLGIGENTTLIFQWNTTGLTPCQNWTISAEAPIVGDANPGDNNLTDGTVKIKMLGDLNADGVVDGQDIVLVIEAIPSYPSHPWWNPDADLNNDRVVDGADIVLTIERIGLICS